MFCFCSTIEDIFQSFCIFYRQQRNSHELPILDPGSTKHANTLIVLRSLITDQCGEWGVVSGYYALISTVWRVKVLQRIYDMRCVFQIVRWRFYYKRRVLKSLFGKVTNWMEVIKSASGPRDKNLFQESKFRSDPSNKPNTPNVRHK